MRPHMNTFLATGAALLLSGSALAQQGEHQTPAETQGQPQKSMDDMMKGCRCSEADSAQFLKHPVAHIKK
jgi:hypothetical protein